MNEVAGNFTPEEEDPFKRITFTELAERFHTAVQDDEELSIPKRPSKFSQARELLRPGGCVSCPTLLLCRSVPLTTYSGVTFFQQPMFHIHRKDAASATLCAQ